MIVLTESNDNIVLLNNNNEYDNLKPTLTEGGNFFGAFSSSNSSNSSQGSISEDDDFMLSLEDLVTDDAAAASSSFHVKVPEKDDETQPVVVDMEGFQVVDNPVVAQKVTEFWHNVRLVDFVTKFDPWLIVPNGSFLDLFDWVPERQRIGPWTMTAKVYFTAILYGTILFGSYLIGQATTTTGSSSSSMFVDHYENTQYPQLFSGWWYYNVVAFTWMCYIMYNILYHTPVRGFAWVTYTVQSWTLLTIRHGLCIVAPVSRTACFLAELLRFPCAVTPALTFTVWNFIIFPVAYCFLMQTPDHKMIFYKVSTCFPMMNLHVLNIVLCICNVVYASPARTLGLVDFYVAFVLLVLYMAWYFLILDRIGFHLYKEYSPRSHPLITITTWTATIVGYIFWFFVFRDILRPVDESSSTADSTTTTTLKYEL